MTDARDVLRKVFAVVGIKHAILGALLLAAVIITVVSLLQYTQSFRRIHGIPEPTPEHHHEP